MSWTAAGAAVIAQFASVEAAIWLGLVFFLFGLAHGAGDEQDGDIGPIGLLHAAAYLIIGGAVAGLFLIVPLCGVALFFGLSAWHFFRSERRFAPYSRVAIAGLAVGGSALFRPDETTAVLSFVTGSTIPDLFSRVLAIVGATGASSGLIAVVKRSSGSGHAVVALLATAMLQPVLAVGLVFLIAHAIPVQERQINAYGAARVARAVALPTALASVGAIVIALAVTNGLIEPYLAVALAFGMATPHMLTERLER